MVQKSNQQLTIQTITKQRKELLHHGIFMCLNGFHFSRYTRLNI